MVLVDTSVWIRALAGRQPYAQGLAELLKNDEVLSHDLVHGELMIGDPDGRRAILAGYLMMDRAATVAHPEVVEFVRARNLSGKGIGWIDVHLLGVGDDPPRQPVDGRWKPRERGRLARPCVRAGELTVSISAIPEARSARRAIP